MAINRVKVQEKAEKLVAGGKLAAAIAEYRILLKDQPNDLNVINRVGDLLARTAKTSEAIELFSRAANLYARGGFFLKSIAIYKKIIKLDPNVVEPRLRLADLYARRDLATEARIEYLAVAETLLKRGDTTKAQEAYEKLIRIEPTNLQARTALANIHIANSDPARALAELRSAARDLESLGLRSESVQIHKQILALPRSEMEVYADSIRALARLGDVAEAVSTGRTLRDRFPEERAMLEALVEALEIGGRGGEAEELVKSCLADTAEQAIPKSILGRLHARAGRRDAAIPMLLEAARELAQSARYDDARGALESLFQIDGTNREGIELRLEIAQATGESDVVAVLTERLVSEFGVSPRTLVPAPSAETGESAVAPPAPRAPSSDLAAGALSREERDFLSEHLTEAEVFIKYGLFEKAIEPLEAVIKRFPSHVEAHARLKTIYSEQGNRMRVIEQCLALAEIHDRAGRNDDAFKILGEARNLDPDNSLVTTWMERIAGSMRSSTQPVTLRREDVPEKLVVEEQRAPSTLPLTAAEETIVISAMEGGGLDLSGELGESLVQALNAEEPVVPEEQDQDFREIFKAFQAKIDEEVDSQDFRTHYDLAIAYKEMGLLDEAISEFEYASNDSERLLDCCAMIGLCLRERGSASLATDWYLKGLASPLARGERGLGLRFDLAETYMEMGEDARAHEQFKAIAGIDRGYRNVDVRLKEMEGKGIGDPR